LLKLKRPPQMALDQILDKLCLTSLGLIGLLLLAALPFMPPSTRNT
jgi:hypothetical protein